MRSLALTLLFLPFCADAFQCAQNYSFENEAKHAERILMIYVTKVELDEEATLRMDAEHPESAGFAKLLTVEYRVVEDLKGDTDYKPKLWDLLGIGTGYVGFIPGVYYLLTLPTQEIGEPTSPRFVNFCDVHFTHHRKDIPEYTEWVNRAKSARDT